MGRPAPGMERQRGLLFAVADEAVDSTVRVEGQIDDDATLAGLLVESMDRHHRNDLLDCPGVGSGLEDRKVFEVGVGQEPLAMIGILIAWQVFGPLFSPILTHSLNILYVGGGHH